MLAQLKDLPQNMKALFGGLAAVAVVALIGNIYQSNTHGTAAEAWDQERIQLSESIAGLESDKTGLEGDKTALQAQATARLSVTVMLPVPLSVACAWPPMSPGGGFPQRDTTCRRPRQAFQAAGSAIARPADSWGFSYSPRVVA